MRHVVLALLSLSLPTSFACAQAPIVVPDDFPDIGAAIAAAAPGTVIHVKDRVPPYPPFVIDKSITIVGSGVDNDAPLVAVAAGGIAIDVQLAPGERASLTRIDCAPVVGATLTRGLVQNGGHLTLEDCRFLAGQDPTGAANLAGVEVIGGDLSLVFSRIEGGSRATSLRAIGSRVSVVSSRCFGANPDSPGIDVVDSTLHANDAWVLGGEQFASGSGGVGLRVAGSSSVWIADSQVRGGMGSPGGSAIVNTSTVPVEFDATTMTAGSTFGGGTPPAVVVGPSVPNAQLLALRWSEQLYRRGTLRMGQPWFVHVRGPILSATLIAFSFGPFGTSDLFTRQPTLDVADIAAFVAVTTDAAGNASVNGSVPNSASLFGAGLWAAAANPWAAPYDVSPHSGVVVRPY